MSLNEMDSKVKELRELRRMADELAAEIDSIQDAIKAHMDAEGVDTINGVDWKVTYKAVTSSRIDTGALKKALPDLAQQFTRVTTARRFSLACWGRADGPLGNGPHRRIRKALCATAVQSKAQRAVTTNHHRGGW